jgi:uncharacterized protein (TIGR03083 family)
MEGPLATAYREASSFFVEVTESVSESEWNAPGLGVWTIRDLIGHTNRSHTLIEEHLLRPQVPLSPDSSYFKDDAIEARGRDAANALGSDPISVVKASSIRAIDLVGATSREATIGSPVATMTLEEYLPSRIAELTIHALDLEGAIGIEMTVPRTALEESMKFVLGRIEHDGVLVLKSLTGRCTDVHIIHERDFTYDRGISARSFQVSRGEDSMPSMYALIMMIKDL